MPEPELVIEVKGGAVVAVYTDLAVNIVINDLDVQEEGFVEVKPLTTRE